MTAHTACKMGGWWRGFSARVVGKSHVVEPARGAGAGGPGCILTVAAPNQASGPVHHFDPSAPLRTPAQPPLPDPPSNAGVPKGPSQHLTACAAHVN